MIGLPSTIDFDVGEIDCRPRRTCSWTVDLVDVGGDRVDFEAFFVAARQRPLNAAAKREHGPHTKMRDPFDFVDLLEVLRVGHRDADRIAHLEQRNRVEPLGHAARQ